MKKLIIIIALLIILTGAAIAALKTLSLGPFLDQAKVEEVKKVKTVTAIFIDMDPLAIPIFKGNKVIATIQIQIENSRSPNDKKPSSAWPRNIVQMDA